MRFGLREYILIAILISFPLASYWVVFRPQNAEIEQARREITHKREMLDKLRAATSRNEDLSRANDEIARSIRAIEARLPSNKEVDAIVRQVSDLAIKTGLDAPLMNSDKPVKAAHYMEQPLKMGIDGNFHGFYEFLLALEALPRITRVPVMKIKRADDADGHMKAEFTLNIYFLEEGAAP